MDGLGGQAGGDASELDDEDPAVKLVAPDEGVRDGKHRGAVDENLIIPLSGPSQHCLEPGGAQKLGGIVRDRPAMENAEVADAGIMH